MNDTNSAVQLRGLMERYWALDEDKANITEDMKQVLLEAKAMGYDTAVLRKVIARMKRDRDQVAEEDALIEMYEGVLLNG